MDSKANQLAPISDFENALIIGQVPNDPSFRSSPLSAVYSWMQTKLDLTGTELIDPTEPGTAASPAVIPPGPEDRKGKFEPEPGFYQGFPEVTSDKRWYFYWDMNSWSLMDMGALPMMPLDVNGGALSFERGESLEENKAEISYEGNINLFDNTKYFSDKFFAYTDVGHPYIGIATDASGWFISEKIPATEGLPYIKTNSAIGFFDSSDTMIAAHQASKLDASIAPIGTRSLRVTAQKNQLSSVMVVQGTSIENYESGRKKVSLLNLPFEITNRWKNVVIVAKSGGQFKTINQALTFINGKDDFLNPWIIIVMPGSYVESVNLIGRYVTLFGYDREATIIRTYTNDYYNPPLDAGGNNNAYNITFFADDDGQTTPPDGVGNMPAYALHFDTSSRYEHLGTRIEGRAVFKNCRFIGFHQHGAGIGISHNQHLIFEDCEFISYANTAFRAHNYLPAGATNQKMSVIRCTMHNKYGVEMWPIMLQDPNNAVGGKDNVDTVFQFIQNVAYYEDNDSQDLLFRHPPIVPGALVGKILLGRGSFGNNIDQLNK